MQENYQEAIGIEYNPKLIDIAEMIRVYKKKNRIQFICSDFQSYEFNKSFYIIFSLANHSTFDEGITDSANAVVYKQNPKVNEKRKVKLGTSIDIYLQ